MIVACKYHVLNRSFDRSHVCKFNTDRIYCVFACDWETAEKRCKFYKPSEDFWALFATRDEIYVRISDNFDSEKVANLHIAPWMKNVIVKKVSNL